VSVEAGRPRAELEEERDFLLGSLRDLESEHEVGDIDDADYVTLKDDYTARAAAVLRALSGERPEPSPSPEPIPSPEPSHSPEPVSDSGDAVDGAGNGGVDGAPSSGGAARWLRRHRRPVLTGLAAVIVAAGVGFALTASSSHRSAGETITGENVGASSVTQLLQQANAAEVKGDSLTELKDTRAILAKDPTQPEALTLEGWVLAQTQQPKLLAQGIGFLRLAEEVDPGLAQAHAYRGIALLSQGDDRDAIPELQWYLDHKPDPAVVPNFRAALAKAEATVAGG
jgi:hypothetical protein